jgi:ABC-type antimicrobial peptide transport system permease subunit
MVRQRWHEFGVRMALGATTADIARLVLRRAIALAASGIAIGLLGTRMAAGLLRSLLFDVSPTDAFTLGAVVVSLLLVSLLASLVPARASTRVQPASALRAE